MTDGPGTTPQHATPGGTPDPGTSTGLSPNVGGALAYVLGALTGILFLVLERKSGFIRFHAAQSTALFVLWLVFWIALSVLSMIFSVIPILGWIVGIVLALVSFVVGLGGFILWIFLMFQAFQGREWEVPWVGRWARELLLGGSV